MASYDEAIAACRETAEAADAITARSVLWLSLHPIKCRRMRRDMLRKRDRMLRLRNEFLAQARMARAGR